MHKMTGEKDLGSLLKSMNPKLNTGEYVFCTLNEWSNIDIHDVVLMFREKEGITMIIEKELADRLKLDYSFVASWITLTVNSSLEAVGLTAAFSKALSDSGISCNVVSGYFHDHIFVALKDTEIAMDILNLLSE